MGFDRNAICLAAYHVATLYHGGQGSKLYHIFARRDAIGYKPSRSEEYPLVLATEGYEAARESFVNQVRAIIGEGSGYHACACCGLDCVCDDAEAAFVRCAYCEEAECAGEGCNC